MRFDIIAEVEDDAEGLEPDQWIEFSEKWTRGESKAVDNASIKEIIDVWLPKKAKAMRIVTSKGLVITNPKDLAVDADWFDDLDQRLYGALSNAIYKCLSQLFFLGAGIVKPSLPGTENEGSAKKKGRN